jgi:MoaA/NifB/PqqE/SkfB family radical SAM enzyme
MTDTLETICVRITKQCNLSCTHCRANSSPNTLDNINLDHLKTFLIRARILGLKHISISGGEPALDHELGDFTNWLLNENFYVTITTNGTIDIVSVLMNSNIIPTHFLRINVSIDGYKKINDQIRGNGCYEKALSTVGIIKRWSNWVGINTVVTKSVLDHFDEFIIDLKEFSIDRFALITPVKQDLLISTQEVFDRIKIIQAKLISKDYNSNMVVYNFLETPNTSVLINTSGDITLSGVSYDDDIIIGNISDFNIQSIRKRIQQQKEAIEKTYFNWKKWKNLDF